MPMPMPVPISMHMHVRSGGRPPQQHRTQGCNLECPRRRPTHDGRATIRRTGDAWSSTLSLDHCEHPFIPPRTHQKAEPSSTPPCTRSGSIDCPPSCACATTRLSIWRSMS